MHVRPIRSDCPGPYCWRPARSSARLRATRPTGPRRTAARCSPRAVHISDPSGAAALRKLDALAIDGKGLVRSRHQPHPRPVVVEPDARRARPCVVDRDPHGLLQSSRPPKSPRSQRAIPRNCSARSTNRVRGRARLRARIPLAANSSAACDSPEIAASGPPVAVRVGELRPRLMALEQLQGVIEKLVQRAPSPPRTRLGWTREAARCRRRPRRRPREARQAPRRASR